MHEMMRSRGHLKVWYQFLMNSSILFRLGNECDDVVWGVKNADFQTFRMLLPLYVNDVDDWDRLQIFWLWEFWNWTIRNKLFMRLFYSLYVMLFIKWSQERSQSTALHMWPYILQLNWSRITFSRHDWYVTILIYWHWAVLIYGFDPKSIQ